MKRNNARRASGDDFSLSLRVLGYLESRGLWAAHCLETDLVGYGKDFDAALKNLLELTDMQTSFAFYMNQPSLLDHPAPVAIIETYNVLMRTSLQRFTKKTPPDKKHKLASIPFIPDPKRSYPSFVPA